MKTAIAAIAALAFLSMPAMAGHISDVDHPDVPNCIVGAANPPNCENLTMQGALGNNGLIAYNGECTTTPEPATVFVTTCATNYQ